MYEWVLGVIGGSGLYDIAALQNRRERLIETPWGAPSDAVLEGEIGGVRLVFLPRHGRGHRIPPSDVNYRANIAALKMAGCTDVLSVSAVGSLREHLPPGSFVAVDQYIDRTFAREKSFFGEGLVAHVSVAHPVCPRLSAVAAGAARTAGATVKDSGTYVVIEGPQFSTRAESLLYQSWQCDVIGMTNMPEAKLAREAELPYASLCMVTDYDCWREADGPVDVAAIVACMHANAGKARDAIEHLARSLPPTRAPSPIDTGLTHSLITAPDARDPATVAKLQRLVPRVFSA
jgi:5'-methylthioadenosine phosphorylase